MSERGPAQSSGFVQRCTGWDIGSAWTTRFALARSTPGQTSSSLGSELRSSSTDASGTVVQSMVEPPSATNPTGSRSCHETLTETGPSPGRSRMTAGQWCGSGSTRTRKQQYHPLSGHLLPSSGRNPEWPGRLDVRRDRYRAIDSRARWAQRLRPTIGLMSPATCVGRLTRTRIEVGSRNGRSWKSSVLSSRIEPSVMSYPRTN